MCSFPPTGLISPVSKQLLLFVEENASTADGGRPFRVKDDIACLVDARLAESKAEEQELFDELPISGIPYFRSTFFTELWQKVERLLPPGPIAAAELGGGEGHWARAIKQACPDALVCTCDLSSKSLQRAPSSLVKIQADITAPIFSTGSLTLASFWVSLHHLDQAEQVAALREAALALAPGGILLLLEPNRHFYPRQLMYQTRMGRDVYFSHREQAIDFLALASDAKHSGLEQIGLSFFTPPYNPEFVKKLRKWPLYWGAVEMLHHLSPRLPSRLDCAQSRLFRFLSLYGLAIFRKTGGKDR